MNIKKDIEWVAKTNNCTLDHYFSALLNYTDSIAIHLNDKLRIQNCNKAAQKYYKMNKTKVLGKRIELLEKNQDILKFCGQLKKCRKSNTIPYKLMTHHHLNNSLVISWTFSKIIYLHKMYGYLMVGHMLMPKKYLEI